MPANILHDLQSSAVGIRCHAVDMVLSQGKVHDGDSLPKKRALTKDIRPSPSKPHQIPANLIIASLGGILNLRKHGIPLILPSADTNASATALWICCLRTCCRRHAATMLMVLAAAKPAHPRYLPFSFLYRRAYSCGQCLQLGKTALFLCTSRVRDPLQPRE